ncbi:LacI family DNA-binding transcriptional regulator [Streptomyces sp. NPDC003247]|uniref:LacI family DNA-binding transcriptional regulator n=1 Tax=Streptomyces sp. NPDC003247 TaxID=3364677 RepID=UPI0036B7FD8A
MSQASSRRRSVTIQDVARAAGVSRAAVSKVIRDASGVSPAMRARVNAAIEELNYRPSVAARSLRGSSYTLGLEVPHLGNRFLTQIVDGALQALEGTRYQLVIAPADGREGYGAIEALADRQVDGIVVVSPRVDADWLERLATGVPVVMLGRHDRSARYDTVVGDDVAGTRQVMEYLLGLGHRRVVHLTEEAAVTAPGTGSPHALRLRAFEEAVRAAGSPELARVVRTGQTEESARATMNDLLSRHPWPTAVFAGHDQLALGALAALVEHDAGREISLVGYDNTDLAAHPAISLTSVDQRGPEMGRRAVAMLLERIEGRDEPQHHVVTPSLVVRDSSGPRPVDNPEFRTSCARPAAAGTPAAGACDLPGPRR